MTNQCQLVIEGPSLDEFRKSVFDPEGSRRLKFTIVDRDSQEHTLTIEATALEFGPAYDGRYTVKGPLVVIDGTEVQPYRLRAVVCNFRPDGPYSERRSLTVINGSTRPVDSFLAAAA